MREIEEDGANGARKPSADHFRDTTKGIERCQREIAAVEQAIRNGQPNMAGLLLALHDWSAELRILEEERYESRAQLSIRDSAKYRRVIAMPRPHFCRAR